MRAKNAVLAIALYACAPPTATSTPTPTPTSTSTSTSTSTPTSTPTSNTTATSTSIQILSPPEEGFYGKELDYGAVRILAHASVSDESMVIAKNKLETLIAHAPKIRANLEASRHEIHVIGLRQFASDLPEHKAQRGTVLDNGEMFDWHMIGGHIVGRLSSCTEATLLEVVGHRLYGQDACTHELAHAIELVGMDNGARAKILAEYDRSIAAGLWKGEYASKNHHEWFAEVTRFYFRDEHVPPTFYDAREQKGRAWLCGYDPAACKLAESVYGGAFDPGVVASEHANLRPGGDEATLKSGTSRVPSRLTIENHSREKIRVVWLDFSGKRDSRGPLERMPSAAPGGVIGESSFATHAFVITDDAGVALCTFVVGEHDTIVNFTNACDARSH